MRVQSLYLLASLSCISQAAFLRFVALKEHLGGPETKGWYVSVPFKQPDGRPVLKSQNEAQPLLQVHYSSRQDIMNQEPNAQKRSEWTFATEPDNGFNERMDYVIVSNINPFLNKGPAGIDLATVVPSYKEAMKGFVLGHIGRLPRGTETRWTLSKDVERFWELNSNIQEPNTLFQAHLQRELGQSVPRPHFEPDVFLCFLPGTKRSYGVLRLKEASRNLEDFIEDECHPGVLIAERSPSDADPPDWLSTGNLKILSPPEERFVLEEIIVPEQLPPVNDILNLDIGGDFLISELKSLAKQKAKVASENHNPPSGGPPKEKLRRPTMKEKMITLGLLGIEQRNSAEDAPPKDILEQPELPEEREAKKKIFTEKGKGGIPIVQDEEDEQARGRKPTAHELRMRMYGQGGEDRKPPGSYWTAADTEKKAKKRRDEIVSKKKPRRKERIVYKEDSGEDMDEEDTQNTE